MRQPHQWSRDKHSSWSYGVILIFVSNMWFFNAPFVWMLLGSVFTAGYWYIVNRFSYWAKKGVPFKKPHWFFGNFEELINGKISMAELFGNMYTEFKNKRFGGVWQFYTPLFIATDPALIRDIMVKDFGTWSSRGITVNLDVDPLSANLVNLDGKKWKSVRAKLTPTFTSGKLKQMHNLLLECGRDFEKYLDTLAASDGTVEAREMSAKFTTDVIGSCAFGIQMNSLGDNESLFRKMGKKIFEPTLRQKIVDTLQHSFKPLFKLLKISVFQQDITDFFLSVMKENVEYREKNHVQRNDFVDILRSLKNVGEPLGEDEVEFDEKLLAAQAFVFFAAGFETSSTVISYCLHELAFNEEVQDRLRQEVHKTKAESNGEISWDGLNNMKYLDMVIQETMRKYPPIPILVRSSIKPYRIPDTDVELPTGTTCVIPVYGLHHDADYYPDPEKFDPERFTKEGKSQRLPFVFLPFGGGPRVCIGLRFAEQQTKMAIIKLIDNFKISPSEKSQNPLQLDPKARFLVPKGGIWIRISKNSPH